MLGADCLKKVGFVVDTVVDNVGVVVDDVGVVG